MYEQDYRLGLLTSKVLDDDLNNNAYKMTIQNLKDDSSVIGLKKNVQRFTKATQNYKIQISTIILPTCVRMRFTVTTQTAFIS